MLKHVTLPTMKSSGLAVAWELIYHHVDRLRCLLLSPRVCKRFWRPCFR